MLDNSIVFRGVLDLTKVDFFGVASTSVPSEESCTLFILILIVSVTAWPLTLFVSFRLGRHDLKCETLPVEFLLSVNTLRQNLILIEIILKFLLNNRIKKDTLTQRS